MKETNSGRQCQLTMEVAVNCFRKRSFLSREDIEGSFSFAHCEDQWIPMDYFKIDWLDFAQTVRDWFFPETTGHGTTSLLVGELSSMDVDATFSTIHSVPQDLQLKCL